MRPPDNPAGIHRRAHKHTDTSAHTGEYGNADGSQQEIARNRSNRQPPGQHQKREGDDKYPQRKWNRPNRHRYPSANRDERYRQTDKSNGLRTRQRSFFTNESAICFLFPFPPKYSWLLFKNETALGDSKHYCPMQYSPYP